MVVSRPRLIQQRFQSLRRASIPPQHVINLMILQYILHCATKTVGRASQALYRPPLAPLNTFISIMAWPGSCGSVEAMPRFTTS